MQQEVVKAAPVNHTVPTDLVSAVDKWGPWVAGSAVLSWFFIREFWPWLKGYIEKRDKWALEQVELAQARLAESQERLHGVIGSSLNQLAEHNKVLLQLKDGLAALLQQGNEHGRKLDLLIAHDVRFDPRESGSAGRTR